ncbi:MAG: DnaA ATPase domain-containing protein [Mycoplasmatales bacterium]
MIDNNLWNTICNEHKKVIGDSLFDFLFNKASPYKINNTELIIIVDSFSLKFLDHDSQNYLLLAKTCANILYSDTFKLEILDTIPNNQFFNNTSTNDATNIDLQKQLESIQSMQNIPEELPKLIAEEPSPTTNIFKKVTTEDSYNNNYKLTKLKSNLTFKNFFYSYENKQVINGAKLIINEIENPSMNPLFIYGESGIGKTHLLNAIGNEVLNLHPEKNILYLHSTDFIEEYTSLFKGALDNTHKIDDFKEKYSNIDVLLVDDIQALESKEGSLNEFFDIFEKMRNKNKMVIIASDKHPNLINFEKRLITRFLSGLNCEVKIPDTDTKKQIFSYYALDRDIIIDEEAISVFINHSNNVRELLGYLNAITLSFISNDNFTNSINKEEAIKILNTTNGNINKFDEEDIINIICDHFKVTKKDLTSKKRAKNIVTCRHFTAYFLRKNLKQKHNKIAHTLGFKDHTAAINAIKQAQKKSKTDKYLKDFNKISQIIN